MICVQLRREIREYREGTGREKVGLQERIEELEEENDELRSRLQVRSALEKKIDDERARHHNEAKMNQLKDTEHKIEKMGRLLEENATLSEKLAESEVLRRRFMDKNQALEKELKAIAQDKQELTKQIAQQKKRINDLTIMKSTNNKILEDKINKLQQENDKCAKENEKYKKALQKVHKKLQQEQE